MVAASELLSGLAERISEVIRDTARRQSSLPALIKATKCWSYGELVEALAEAATTMPCLGVRAGDRVMIASGNSLPLAALVLGASEIDPPKSSCSRRCPPVRPARS
jgi:long-chain acyl-CoA synthetase